ncbi:MAG: hypothetical protein R3272_09180 [Candidatus Promineifilaceae bacterium]|nr:hypothetical protein [Candidatus Promineifilaceae bacterium]
MSQPDYDQEVPADEFDDTVPVGQGEEGPSKEEVREAAQELAEREEGRDPLLTPDHLETAVGELEEELFAEKAEHGLDQLEGPEIEAVMREDVEADEAPGEEE